VVLARSIVYLQEVLTSGVELFRLSLADLLRGVAMMVDYGRFTKYQSIREDLGEI
jgi:hypothetical protein